MPLAVAKPVKGEAADVMSAAACSCAARLGGGIVFPLAVANPEEGVDGEDMIAAARPGASLLGEGRDLPLADSKPAAGALGGGVANMVIARSRAALLGGGTALPLAVERPDAIAGTSLASGGPVAMPEKESAEPAAVSYGSWPGTVHAL